MVDSGGSVVPELRLRLYVELGLITSNAWRIRGTYGHRASCLQPKARPSAHRIVHIHSKPNRSSIPACSVGNSQSTNTQARVVAIGHEEAKCRQRKFTASARP